MIYLDYNATTPVDPRVLAEMLPMFGIEFANPSSKHPAGQRAAERVEKARGQVAELLGTQRKNLIFTSGATESAALGIRGAVALVAAARPGRHRVLVGATEHKAVLEAAGPDAQTIRVLPDGTLDLEHLRWMLDTDVALVAVMAANNETGVLHDVAAAARLAHQAGALFFCDTTQAAGRVPVTLDEWGIDLAVASAHKIYGPKGVGVLAATRAVRAKLPPLFGGGGQERGLRGGTSNAAGIVGYGAAAALAAKELPDWAHRQSDLVRLLRDELAVRVDTGGEPISVHGQGAPRLPNTLCVRIPGVEADAVLSCLPDVMISAGAACSSAIPEPSHVLLAMGVTPTAAEESLRFSVGRPTTEAEIRTAAGLVAQAVARVRELNNPTRKADYDRATA